MLPVTSNNRESSLNHRKSHDIETVCINTSSGTRNVSLQNTSKSPDRNPDSNLRSTQNKKSITEYDIKKNEEQIATEQLCKLLEPKAYEDVKTTPEDILTRGHPAVAPVRGGAFSLWYNDNKTNPELQDFLTEPLQNTNIAKKLKSQIVRYEIDAPYEILRKSHKISGDYDAELPACLMLTKEDLFDENNNYLQKKTKVEINNSDETEIVFKWYFEQTSFSMRFLSIIRDAEYEDNRSLKNGMYSESETAKKLQKYLEYISKNKLNHGSVHTHWVKVNQKHWYRFPATILHYNKSL